VQLAAFCVYAIYFELIIRNDMKPSCPEYLPALSSHSAVHDRASSQIPRQVPFPPSSLSCECFQVGDFGVFPKKLTHVRQVGNYFPPTGLTPARPRSVYDPHCAKLAPRKYERTHARSARDDRPGPLPKLPRFFQGRG